MIKNREDLFKKGNYIHQSSGILMKKFEKRYCKKERNGVKYR